MGQNATLLNVTADSTYVGGPKNSRNLKKNYLKYLYKFETLVPFEVHPCDWMQQSQYLSQCWKHCLKSSKEMLSRAVRLKFKLVQTL